MRKFTITWEQYAFLKRRKSVCCGKQCPGCCFTPRFQEGADVWDPVLLEDIYFMAPEYSRFYDQNAPDENIITSSQKLRGNIIRWSLQPGDIKFKKNELNLEGTQHNFNYFFTGRP